MRRNTKEREIVYNIIDKLGHASTKQIIEALKKEDISLATIYRNLTILLEENKIKKIRVSAEEEIYETIKKAHFHFRCSICKEIYDVDKSLIHIEIADNSNLKNAEIGEHDIVFYGICPNCKKKMEEN